jgi:hypothetical protein
MTSHDAYWLANQGTAASWAYGLLVLSAVEDVEAAVAAEDWPTAVESAATALRTLAYCQLLLDGYLGSDHEHDILLALGRCPDWLTDELHRLPPATTDERSAREAAAAVHRVARRVEDHMPVSLPALRTPTGLLPSLKLASQLEKLRTRLGLAPYAWDNWDV